MKRNQFLLTLLSAGTVALTSFTPGRTDDQTPYQTKTFSGNIKAVRAETSGGSLTIEGGTDMNAKVEMYVRGNNGNSNLDKAEIEERLKDYDVSISQEGSTIIATAKRRGNNNNDWKKSLSIGFKFYTPRTVSTDLRTSGGSISLTTLTGPQKFRTSGGSLHMSDINGDINGQTSGGSIHVDRCQKNIDLQTSGGSIEAKSSSGTMRLHTSGGSIRLTDLRGIIDAQTSGGSVNGSDIEGDLKAGTSGGSVRLANVSGSIDASTSAGSVDVSITKLDGPVRLVTSAGNINVKMPLNKGISLNLSGNRIKIPLNNFSGDTEKDHIKGTLNGGGVAVTLSANSGSVYVNQ
jgi:hypothetical protein